ncbi:SDR family NAD(P)-dependent oxidoreductase [Streptomyces anandii]|uniref:SDR family NAD(P)-dependent oxidoreductase n=1 Tax=Streptomyces anandii TaxID=285454 RepID=UPI0037006D89
MSRILVTGSADGLGRAAAASLPAAGHEVVVHARDKRRAAGLDPLTVRGAGIVVGDFTERDVVGDFTERDVVGDFTERDAVRRVAAELSGSAPLDAVVHNAGVWSGPAVMPVNVIAPYLLTALLPGPRRLVYLSSGSHFRGRPRLGGVDWRGRTAGSYADSKLFVTTLAAAVARLRPGVLSNAVDPGWVPTRMGGPNAPDDLELGHETQAWLAAGDDPRALTSGRYRYHRRLREPHRAVHDTAFQTRLLHALAEETGAAL